MSTVTFDILARDRASDTFRKVGNETQALTGSLERLKSVALKAFGALAVAEISRKVIDFGRDSVKAYSEAEQQQARLTDAYRRFPALADVQIRAFRELNEAIQRKTGTDHNQLAAAEATLAQFNLTGHAIKNLIPLVNDYAQKTGQDVTTAATGVGRALLGNTRALKSVGIEFKATGNQAKDAATLTQLLRDKLGGFAAREGKTAAGQAKIMSASFRDAKEQLGKALAPVVLQVGHALTSVMIPAVRGVATILDRVVPTVERWVNSLRTRLAPTLTSVGNFIQSKVLPALRSFGEFITQHVLPGVEKFAGAILGGFRNALHTVEKAFSDNREGIRNFLSIVGGLVSFIASKVVPIIGTVLGKALEMAARNFALTLRVVGLLGDAIRGIAHFFAGPFLTAVGTMVSKVIEGFKFITDIWLTVVGAIVHGAADAFGWIPGLGGKLKAAAAAFDGFRSSVDSTLAGIASDAAAWGQKAGASWNYGFGQGVNPKNDPGHPGYVAPAPSGGASTKPRTPTFSYDPTALATTTGASAGKAVASGVTKALQQATSRMRSDLQTILGQFRSERDSLISSFGSLQTTGTDALGASGAAQSVKAQLKADAALMHTFARLWHRLADLGLDPRLLAQFAGPDYIPAMRELLHEGRGGIRQVNRLERSIARDAAGIARSSTQDQYGALIHHDLDTLPPKLRKEFLNALHHARFTVEFDNGKHDRHNGRKVRHH